METIFIMLFIGITVFSIIHTASVRTNQTIVKQLVENSNTWKDTIGSIREKKVLKKNSLHFIGLRLYEYFLCESIRDLSLSTDELTNLSEIEIYFSLPKKTVDSIKDKYAQTYVDKLSKLKISNKELSPSDKEEILHFANAFNLTAATVEAINRKNALELLRQEKDKALSDSRLTDEEEKSLRELTSKLGLTEEDFLGSMDDRSHLAYCKLMWDIENGRLPEIESPIILQKNELCHFSIDAERLKTKTVTTGYSGGSRGVSVRIAKGVSYRVGAYRGHPIKEEVTMNYPGTLVITSKRLVFAAPNNGFSFPLSKLDNIEQYSNGLGFQKGSTHYLVSMKYPDLVGSIICAVVNKL